MSRVQCSEPERGAPPGGAAATLATQRPASSGRLERRLLGRVAARCQGFLVEACASSTLPPEFLGALTANESGGDPEAARFEPSVYRHLTAVVGGAAPVYGGIAREPLEAGIEEMLHPKAAQFHATFLTPQFAEEHGEALRAAEDEALRELATSWGFTQIMGYHVLGRWRTVRDLLEPRIHFRLATELLTDFARRHGLALGRDFSELFRCWNTGQPDGTTADPSYVAKGLSRMSLYRQEVAGSVHYEGNVLL